MSKTDNILYGDIPVYDYEHSGDSRTAYNILASFGITDTYFQNNGDGNVAIIEFSMPYNKENACILAKRMDNAGYGVSFINLYEFEDTFKLPQMTPTMSVAELRKTRDTLPSWYQLKDNLVESNLNAPVVVKYENYITTLKRDPSVLENTLQTLADLECSAYHVSRNDMELTINAVTTLGNVRKLAGEDWRTRFNKFLFSFCNPQATRFGEYPYGLAWWVKDYPAFTKHILNIE